jgi:hypothetical protein
MMRISEEAIRVYLSDWKDTLEDSLKEMLSDHDMGWMRHYRSPCGRYKLNTTKNTNIPMNEQGIGWNLHIDNSDMCTIGSLSVEYIEQVKQVMEIYKDY